MDPLVSIVIPVYNRQALIAETINSAISQTYKNIEIIIVDNHSTDDTMKILNSFSAIDRRVKVYQNAENVGPVKNWINCLNYANGEYLKILWSDDLIEKDFISETIYYLENDKDIAFVYTRTIVFSKDNETELYSFGDSGKYLCSEFIKYQLMGGRSVPVSPGNAIFRTNDVKQNLVVEIENNFGYDFSKFGAGNDLLIFLKTAVNYPYFYFINRNLSYFRAHEKSLTLQNNFFRHYWLAKIYFMNECIHDQSFKNKVYTLFLIKYKMSYKDLFESGMYSINPFYYAKHYVMYKFGKKIRRIIKYIRRFNNKYNKIHTRICKWCKDKI